MRIFDEPPPHAAFEHRDASVGFEVVFFERAAEGIVVRGHTARLEDGEPSGAAYEIALDLQWRTRRARVRGRSRLGSQEVEIAADGEGRWTRDGHPLPELDGCLDLDLEASSLTNTFPVRRLGLAAGDRAEAPAAYVRALDLTVERLEQQYARLDDAHDGRVRFDYASPRFDTRCLLEYDRTGLVLAYPGIAVRRA